MIYRRNERVAWNGKFHLSYNMLLLRRADFWLLPPPPASVRTGGRTLISWHHIIIIIIWANVIGKAAPNCWKMVIKSIRKVTKIGNNGIIQLQFFHRCIVGATASKLVNGLPRFPRITFRLTESIRIIRCFRSLDVPVYCISQLFILCPVAWIIPTSSSYLFFGQYNDRACLSSILNWSRVFFLF